MLSLEHLNFKSRVRVSSVSFILVIFLQLEIMDARHSDDFPGMADGGAFRSCRV